MTGTPPLDLADAHKFFSATCFNKTWDLIDKPDRTVADDEEMVRLSQTSLWHWTQRADCTPRTLSVGYWLVARTYALTGQAGEARRYGNQALAASEQEAPFFRAYAHEALARAAMVAGDREEMNTHLKHARKLADEVADADEKNLLINDFKTITLD